MGKSVKDISALYIRRRESLNHNTMSSTSGLQNLLINVFRPVYTYDPAAVNGIFVPKLEMSNIDTYSGNTISVFTAAVGDNASNVYVGSNAGNVYTNINASSNNTAIGYGAGNAISNVLNSTFLGFNAGAGSSNASTVIGIGANVGGAGISNIFIGNGTKSTGNNNILVGHGIDIGADSNTLRLGSTVFGDLSTNWIGIGTNDHADVNTRLDISGNTYIKGQVGINIIPGGRTLDVNGDFRAQDASANVLDFTGGLTRSSGGYASIQGDISAGIGITPLGVLKKGIINVSAVDQADSGNSSAIILFATSLSNASSLGSVASGDASIFFTGSNIELTNTTSIKTYSYNITYFPLP